MVALIRQEPGSVFTTMFDLYALPSDWPGREDALRQGLKNGEAIALIEGKLSEAIQAELNDFSFPVKFIPYLSQHEYEALLFSDPAILAGVTQGAGHEEAFRAIVDECGECEMINDRPETAPSKRILKIVPGYSKTVDGIAAAERIGLPTLRAKCPHFGSWLERLEQLGEAE